MANQPACDDAVNPLLEALIAEGPGNVLSIDGYIGPRTARGLRLYSDLSLYTYVELAQDDIVRVEASRRTDGLSIVYLRRDAGITYGQSVTISVDQLLTASAASATSSCGCTGATGAPGSIALRNTGDVGADPCATACDFSMEMCMALARVQGTSAFWCKFDNFFCKLRCRSHDRVFIR